MVVKTKKRNEKNSMKSGRKSKKVMKSRKVMRGGGERVRPPSGSSGPSGPNVRSGSPLKRRSPNREAFKHSGNPGNPGNPVKKPNPLYVVPNKFPPALPPRAYSSSFATKYTNAFEKHLQKNITSGSDPNKGKSRLTRFKGMNVTQIANELRKINLSVEGNKVNVRRITHNNLSKIAQSIHNKAKTYEEQERDKQAIRNIISKKATGSTLASNNKKLQNNLINELTTNTTRTVYKDGEYTPRIERIKSETNLSEDRLKLLFPRNWEKIVTATKGKDKAKILQYIKNIENTKTERAQKSGIYMDPSTLYPKPYSGIYMTL